VMHDGLRAEPELHRDAPIREAIDESMKHLELAVGELGVRARPSPTSGGLLAASDRALTNR
jgi:hypothetical protein